MAEPAKRSTAALAKVATQRLCDDTVAHRFRTMMAELSGIVRNTCRRHGAEPSEPTFRMMTTPDPKQARALALLDTIRVQTERCTAKSNQPDDLEGDSCSQPGGTSG